MLDFLIYKNPNIISFKTISSVAISITNDDQSSSYKHHQTITVSTRRNTLQFALLKGVIQLPDSTIIIYTDSLSALNNLK